MKVAIFSDLQGVSHQSWKRFIDQGLPKDVECVITLGDIDKYYLKSLKESTPDSTPWFGVYGNHDFYGDLEKLGIDNIHTKTIKFKDYVFGGLEGSILYKNENRPMYTQFEAYFELYGMNSCDILISHNSPIDIHEKDKFAHEGFRALLDYIKKHQPKYAFHGHQHINKETMIGKSNVIGVYGGWLFDLNTGDKQEILKADD